MANWLDGKKTYIAAAAVVVAALAGFLGGDLTLGQAVANALEGLGLAALRSGVAKAS